MKMYVDGVLQTDTNPNTEVISPGGLKDFAIGANNVQSFGPTFLFNGLIDEFEFFDRALSATEIQALFDAGSAGKCKPGGDDDDDGVPDEDDLCPGTFIPEETVPSVRLGTNRWTLMGDDFDFDTTPPKGKGPKRSYNTTETGGCSCEQIIVELGLGNGHTKFGCSISAMDDWVALVAGTPKRGTGEVTSVPEAFVLEANYPNPFNPQTTIRFGLPEASVVMLAVYDVLGREVRVLVDGVREAGMHEVVFEAGDLPSGTYLYRLETPQGSFVKTMQLVK